MMKRLTRTGQFRGPAGTGGADRRRKYTKSGQAIRTASSGYYRTVIRHQACNAFTFLFFFEPGIS
jgi:hypothetical protein